MKVSSAARALCSRLASSRSFSTANTRTEQIVATSYRRIKSLFGRYGDEGYIGEPMSITQHSVQTCLTALKGGEPVANQLSCLLHDVGHLCGLEAGHPPGMDGCGTEKHEVVCAELLGGLGFSDDITYLTLHHVNAKRYLCGKDKKYHDKLSDSSKTTLKYQGGPMTTAECEEVEKDERWATVLRMRTYDEAGKDPDAMKKSYKMWKDEMMADLHRNVTAQLEDGATQPFPLSRYAHSYVLSSEQQRFFHGNKFLVIRDAINDRDIEDMPANEMADVVTDITSQLIGVESILVEEGPVSGIVSYSSGDINVFGDSYIGMGDVVVFDSDQWHKVKDIDGSIGFSFDKK